MREQAPGVDSRYAMWRLFVTLLIMTVGSAGMYVVSVVLPAMQADFGIARADASLPYTLLMIGFGVGSELRQPLGVAVFGGQDSNVRQRLSPVSKTVAGASIRSPSPPSR